MDKAIENTVKQKARQDYREDKCRNPYARFSEEWSIYHLESIQIMGEEINNEH